MICERCECSKPAPSGIGVYCPANDNGKVKVGCIGWSVDYIFENGEQESRKITYYNDVITHADYQEKEHCCKVLAILVSGEGAIQDKKIKDPRVKRF